MANAQDLIEAYLEAITRLTASSGKGSMTPELALETFIARDAVATVLASDLSVPASCRRDVVEVDRSLRRIQYVIVDAIGVSRLTAWRESLAPDSQRWWWRLDELVLAPTNSSWSRFWYIVAIAAVGLTLALSLEIVRRASAVGPDVHLLSGQMGQALLALIAAGSTTAWGRRSLAAGMARLSLPSRYWNVAVALLLLLPASLCWHVLTIQFPNKARVASDWAVIHVEQDTAGAIAAYEYAMRLDPDRFRVHHNLGYAYEKLLANDKAREAYGRALAADSWQYEAYNNLARLLIRDRRDFSGAIGLVDQALTRAEQIRDPADPRALTPHTHLALLRTRGWALFELELHKQAMADLERALKIDRDSFATYCLIAQVREAQGRSADVPALWAQCQHAPPNTVEPAWLYLAKERQRYETHDGITAVDCSMPYQSVAQLL